MEILGLQGFQLLGLREEGPRWVSEAPHQLAERPACPTCGAPGASREEQQPED